MKIFISWSGETSRKVAIALRDWFPCLFNEAQPFVSSEDIRKGNRWFVDISQELSKSNFGVICLTKDNLTAPWILFEAGALSKSLKESHVCTLLLGSLRATDIKGPLAGFQATPFEKEEMRKLVRDLNAAAEQKKLADPTLEKIFEKWWPDLEKAVTQIIQDSGKAADQVAERSDRDLLNEILDLARSLSKHQATSAVENGRAVADELFKLRQLLALDVRELELPQTALMVLKSGHIRTVGQLAMRTAEELRKFGMREPDIVRIIEILETLGLSLGMRFDDRLLDDIHVFRHGRRTKTIDG